MPVVLVDDTEGTPRTAVVAGMNWAIAVRGSAAQKQGKAYVQEVMQR
jgi:hypothetical protein